MASNPDNIILVTRPEPQADGYALELREKFGAKAYVLLSPLLRITPLPVTPDLRGVEAVLFTSGNAVRVFATLSDRRDIACFCVGNKTASAARAVGFSAMSASGTVSDLVTLVAARLEPNEGVCLHVRGRHTSGNIAADLAARGYDVHEIIVYDQKRVSLSLEARKALQGSRHVIVPLFSPRTAEVFRDETRGLTLDLVTLVCISNAVAEKLDTTGIMEIKVAQAPTAAGVTREIDAFL